MTTPQDRQIVINRLEEFARRDPAAYRFRVMLIAALGYAYLFAVVVGLVVFVGLVIWGIAARGGGTSGIYFLWIALVLIGIVLQSMWIKITPPNGKEVQREQAPELFDLIAHVRTRLAGPKVHHVLLSDEFNAGIVQVPRFGMFGWTHNYLVVGLPLMNALGPEEFRAVIAHEFGHLSGKHGRFTGWIYRLRQSWIQVLTRIERERHYASFLFEPFIKWYAPYFNAYSFVLGRAQEYEADRYSVDTAGPEATARALVQMEVKARALTEEYWSKFYRQALDQPKPPRTPFAIMLSQLEQPLAPVKVEKWLRRSLKVQTGYDDTHPALAERLTAIGFAPDGKTSNTIIRELDLGNGSIKKTAAEQYLKKVPGNIADNYNRLWHEQVVQNWKQTHEYLQQSQKRLVELEESSKTRRLTIDEQWERAKCTVNLTDPATALPLAQEIIQQDPNHANANMAVGATLVEQEDMAGVEYLEKAMRLDASLTGDACELLFNFYQAQGRPKEAETYRARAEEYYTRMQRLQNQAVYLTVQDHFEPHDLDKTALNNLQDQLDKVRGLTAAYLVRKIAEGVGPLYVLAVFASWKSADRHKHVDDLIDEVAANVKFSGPTLFVSLDVKRFLTDTLAQVPNSLIYRRD